MGMFINAGPLYGIAKAAYERTKKVSTDREIVDRDPPISIVFSSASLEAFINEAAELAIRPNSSWGDQNPTEVENFGVIASELDVSHASIHLKFMLASVIFSGRTFDKSRQPYQNFDKLIRLRNDLMHLRPSDRFVPSSNYLSGYNVLPPRSVENLRDNNILYEPSPNEHTTWYNRICTRAVARWACNVVSEMVNHVINIVPECEYKERLKFFYSDPFTPVV